MQITPAEPFYRGWLLAYLGQPAPDPVNAAEREGYRVIERARARGTTADELIDSFRMEVQAGHIRIG